MERLSSADAIVVIDRLPSSKAPADSEQAAGGREPSAKREGKAFNAKVHALRHARDSAISAQLPANTYRIIGRDKDAIAV
jgi:hypothetical protein